MIKTLVVDDFFEEELFQKIAQNVLGPEIPWYFREMTIYETSLRDENTVEGCYLSHIFFTKENGPSSKFTLVSPSKYQTKIEKLMSLKLELVRLRANLSTPDPKCSQACYRTPHTDQDCQPDESITVIHYLNDTDGDTVFFDNSGFEVERISPKRNRLVVFDTSVLHAGVPPFNFTDRFIVNINYNIRK